MSYQEALEAAGTNVFAFQAFGSYQGDWWARVSGGWIHGYYGSCSGCDAFEAEFNWREIDRKCEEHSYKSGDFSTCVACQEKNREYQSKLAAFGASYLHGLMTQEEAEKEASRHLDWDSDAPKMLEFIRANK